ncbi:MAG: sugar ABC transporter substrate-binding protein [Anaerolineales bacterium]|nr:sugar ABC transporter substrate-binding protein [Anaerolineales bacterium]MDW8161536.1 substrate-binding domain-containing protein [Anaerolineales bacterium]
MKAIRLILYSVIILTLLVSCAPAATEAPSAPAKTEAPAAPAQTEAPQVQEPVSGAPTGKKLTYCYITPGPDTWYKRDVEGFQYGASLDGVEVIVVNSDYDVEKELANIEFCINQGSDGISVFSFNENGAIIAARRGQEAGIPVVATDSVGSVAASGQEIVAEIDFDWTAMGETYAQWMADNYPGEDFVIITGNFESIPCQKINEAMKRKSEELGKNKLLDIRDADYNPNKAVEVAQDLLQSGLDFKIMFIMDEDMAAAVIRMLKDRGVLNNPIKVIAQNGSPAGIPLVKSGELKFTISSSPGWEGYIAYLALHNYVIGKIRKVNQHIFLPIMPVTEENIDDPMQVVPWEVVPDVYEKLTQQYFPELLEYRKQ